MNSLTLRVETSVLVLMPRLLEDPAASVVASQSLGFAKLVRLSAV